MRKKIIIGVVALLVIAVSIFTYRAIFGARQFVVDSSAQGEKISEYAHPESLITPYQLKDLMDRGQEVVVIGALNPVKGDAPIEGSFTVWRPDYSADEEDYGYEGMRETNEAMETMLSNFGASQGSTIVVYAANSHHDAARLWWQIKLLGHEDVRYLDGGLNAWLGAKYPTGNANPVVEATAYKGANPLDESVATIEDVLEALRYGSVIDTRSADEVTGTSTKSGALGPGKIDGSLHINWTSSVAEDTTLLSRPELEAIYGTIEDKLVVTYCQSGVRSAHTMFVLSQVLGYENVKNYDGSWIEWAYEYYENKNTSLPTTNVEK